MKRREKERSASLSVFAWEWHCCRQWLWQLTKDGQLISRHNDSMDGISNGTGLIRGMTLAEPKFYDFGFCIG